MTSWDLLCTGPIAFKHNLRPIKTESWGRSRLERLCRIAVMTGIQVFVYIRIPALRETTADRRAKTVGQGHRAN
jgi:hypothetical protein